MVAVAPEDQLVFEASMDGLVRAIRPRITSLGAKRLLEAGFDLNKPLLPAYPAPVWARYVQIISADLYASLEPTEAQRRVGALTVDAFSQGFIGSAMFGMVRLLGPDRTIARMTRNFRTGCNFLETRSTRMGRGRYEVWFNDVTGVQGFYQGLLEAGMRHVGAQDLETRILSTDGRECTFGVQWSNGTGPE